MRSNKLRLTIKGLKEIYIIHPTLIPLIAIKSVLISVFPFINIIFSAQIVNKIYEKAAFVEVLLLVLITVIMNCVFSLLSAFMKHMTNIANAQFTNKYHMRLSRKIMSLDYEAIENTNTHLLYQKIKDLHDLNGGGIWCIAESVTILFEGLFSIVLSILCVSSLFSTTAISGSVGFHFVNSIWGSILLILCVLLNAVTQIFSSTQVTKRTFSFIDDIIPFNRVFEYYLGRYMSTYHAGKDIRICNQHLLIREEYMSVLDDAINVSKQISHMQTKYSFISTLSEILLKSTIYLFVGIKALLGVIGVGSIVQYVGSITEFTSSFTKIVKQFSVLRANSDALTLYFEFIELPRSADSGTYSLDTTDANNYEIEFHNVSFRYPGADIYVLRNINLKIHAGDRLAIVGMNGSGKTTLIKLLCGLHTPTNGKITLNGIDIKEYRHEDYFSLFSAVFQDFKLFSFSVGQNIAANMEYDLPQVLKCLEKAGLSERFSTMKYGADTPIFTDFDEEGVNISGGEAQKLALARALYKDAPFFLLDEPTAALDPLAEYEVFSQFNEIVADKAVVFVSHRLASCCFCDKVAVLDKGELVQLGSHTELLSNIQGKYHELWSAQAQYYQY